MADQLTTDSSRGVLRSFKSYEGNKELNAGLPQVITRKAWQIQAAQRPTSYQRGYGNKYQSARVYYLTRHPECEGRLATGEKCRRRAVECDHKRPVRYGGSAHDVGNLQALCRECHRAKTQQDDAVARRNGWGAPRW